MIVSKNIEKASPHHNPPPCDKHQSDQGTSYMADCTPFYFPIECTE